MGPLATRALAIITLSLLSAPVFGHGGGLDGYGCHHDRKRGGYHCHRGSLAGRSFSSQSAMLQALRGRRDPSPPPVEAPPHRPDPPTESVPRAEAPPPSESIIRLTRPKSLADRLKAYELTLTAQNLLMTLGYYPGPLNGEPNSGTASAIRRFQHHHRLPEDGQVTGKLLVKLSEQVRLRR